MLHLPDGNVVAPEYAELADRVTNGDGVVWAGDPWMDLRLGVIEHRGRIVARRLEVWRWCEDGAERRIGTWRPEEAYKIPLDLARMRSDQPGGSKVLESIDAHNAEMEDKASRAMQDALGETVERLAHNLAFKQQGNARNTHQLPGKNPLAKDA